MDDTQLRTNLLAHAALVALVGQRVYYMQAPQTPVKPYVVYSLIVGLPANYMDAAATIDQKRYQLDLYAATALETIAIRAAILSAIDGTGTSPQVPFAYMVGDNPDQFDFDTESYRKSLDVSYWLTR